MVVSVVSVMLVVVVSRRDHGVTVSVTAVVVSRRMNSGTNATRAAAAVACAAVQSQKLLNSEW